MTRFFCLFFVLTALGCSLILPVQNERKLLLLDNPRCSKSDIGEPPETSISLATIATTDLIRGDRIIFNREQNSRNFYQQSFWAEPPAAQLATLLLDHLDCSGRFARVSRGLEAASTDLSLALEIREFRHDARENPGSALIEIRSELYDNRRHKLIATRIFTETESLQSFNAESAVRALSSASGRLIDQIVAWVAEKARPRETE